MNLFTLGASGLLALGLPLAAPWLVQDIHTTTAAVVAPTPLVIQEPSTIPAPKAETTTTRQASLERRYAVDAAASMSDETARELAELQARIAMLQAQVAELTAVNRSPRTFGRDAAPLRELDGLDEVVLEARERARVDRLDAEDARELLLDLERARSSQLNGLAQERGESKRRMNEATRAARQSQDDAREAAMQAEVAEFERSLKESTLAANEIESRLKDGNLRPRQRARLEEQLEELHEEIDAKGEALEDLQDEDLEEFDFDFDFSKAPGLDFEWFGKGGDKDELRSLGYLDEDEDEDEDDGDDWEENDDAFSFDLRSFARGGQPGNGGVWLAPSAQGGGGWNAPRTSGGGDVIVNLGGSSGGNDAEMIQLLREIRDEVRGLRSDLRGLHGGASMVPAAPRAPAAPSAPRALRRIEMGQLLPLTTTDGPATAFGHAPTISGQPSALTIGTTSSTFTTDAFAPSSTSSHTSSGSN